jgi:hypothetical protein
MILVHSYVMLGGGLFILPGRNFARFNLMMFILFCLVVRTAYQGVQFNMMLKEMRPRDLQTIDELFAHNFNICAYESTKAMMVGTEFENRFELHKIQPFL